MAERRLLPKVTLAGVVVGAAVALTLARRAGKTRSPDRSAFGSLIEAVDFPAFVAGLIKGVFQAIVDVSIRQMAAYGQLLGDVAMAVRHTVDRIRGDGADSSSTARCPP